MVGLVAVEFHDEIADGADGRAVEGVDFDEFVVGEFVVVLVDVVDDVAEAQFGEGEFVGKVELFGVGEQVGVLRCTDHAAVEAVFGGVAVGERCAMGDG